MPPKDSNSVQWRRYWWEDVATSNEIPKPAAGGVGKTSHSARPERPRVAAKMAPARPVDARRRMRSPPPARPSLAKMLLRWRATVFSLRTSSAAMARLVLPAATTRRTSTSRGLSRLAPPPALRARCARRPRRRPRGPAGPSAPRRARAWPGPRRGLDLGQQLVVAAFPQRDALLVAADEVGGRGHPLDIVGFERALGVGRAELLVGVGPGAAREGGAAARERVRRRAHGPPGPPACRPGSRPCRARRGRRRPASRARARGRRRRAARCTRR
jgi:hypothetical protein